MKNRISLRQLFQDYGSDQPLPQLAYLLLCYSAFFQVVEALARARQYSMLGFKDLIILGMSTHKLARIIAKDRITSPLRAPFTRFDKSAGGGEVEETVRGKGVQAVVGELISCPYCMSPWAGAGLLLLFFIDKNKARLLCSILTCVTISHFLHRIYTRLESP